MANKSEKKDADRLEIFRMSDAPALHETGHMSYENLSDVELNGLKSFAASGGSAGADVRTIFSRPGFSLIYNWYKSGYPLPPHSHDVDCAYYIIAGSLQVGKEALTAGDGFFVPAHRTYSYVPGIAGVEVLEIRGAETFDIKFIAKTAETWAKIANTVSQKTDAWIDEQKPSEMT